MMFTPLLNGQQLDASVLNLTQVEVQNEASFTRSQVTKHKPKLDYVKINLVKIKC